MSYSNPIHIKGNTYYFEANTNVGLYISGNNAIIIDSGNDSEAGRQILKYLRENNLNLTMIINTHSNADHTGGNNFLQKRTNCKIVSTPIEAGFIENPILESSFLFGGFPFEKNLNKFLLAKESKVTDFIDYDSKILDTNFETFFLPGHFFGMVGIKTPDNVCFIADSLFSKEIIEKYHIMFAYDIAKFKESLNYLKELNAEWFVPSHAKITQDISFLVDFNLRKIDEIINVILDNLTAKKTFEQLLSLLFYHYDLKLDENQYILVGSTLRSYLTYLEREKKVRYFVENNFIFWENFERKI